jgi:hypothetical protein
MDLTLLQVQRLCEGMADNLVLTDFQATEKMPSALEQITSQNFKDGRNRRWGTANPTKFDVAFWNAMVKCGASPYTARRLFLDESSEAEQEEERWAEDDKKYEGVDVKNRLFDSFDDEEADKETTGEEVEEGSGRKAKSDAREVIHAEHGMYIVGEGLCNDDPSVRFWSNPIWCNVRSDATETKLADGTLVQIGGEYEVSCLEALFECTNARQDSYDPDFMIYNDVIVFHPGSNKLASRCSRDFDIYGYPKDVFPPTDGHTATYVPSLNAIVVIGNVSAPDVDVNLAANGTTPVYVLNASTWKMEKKATSGAGPGIIWRHVAELQDGVLRVTGKQSKDPYSATRRKVRKDGKDEIVDSEYEEAWELNLDAWTWVHHALEWTTMPKKKRGWGRGRGD